MDKRTISKKAAKSIAGALTNVLKNDANSATCLFSYQPKQPQSIEKFKTR